MPADAASKLRRRIVAAAQLADSAGRPVAAVGVDEAESGATVPEGTLRDRIGGRGALLAALNSDFMPLASECVAAALHRDPTTSGMIALGIEVAADAELGAVIERAEPTQRNEVIEAELLTCLRETGLSLILPPQSYDGREAFEITIPVDVEAVASSQGVETLSAEP